jgi:hypothetical protein
MRWLGRWLRRAILLFLVVVLGLLSPIAYVETMCRPVAGDPDAYQPLVTAQWQRPESRTLLTYPEWHIVHAYDDYAEVIRTGDPHDFAFLPSISTFWGSLCALSKSSGDYGGFPWETKQMVYTIGVSFTAELLLKATYEETLGRIATWIRGPVRAPLDDLSASQAGAYANFLTQTPWYKWDFMADRFALQTAAGAGFRDQERRIALGLEYRAKSAYAAVIAAAVAGLGEDALRMRVIVAGMTPEALAQLSDVTVIGAQGTGTEIDTPRYRAFTVLARDIAAGGGAFLEIAGNDDILFTLITPDPTYPGALHSFARQGNSGYRHLVMVKVSDLADAIRNLPEAATLEHIHDY